MGDTDTFDDELFAYLMFTYLRGIVERHGCRAWLTYEQKGKTLVYVIRLGPANNLLTGLPFNSSGGGLITGTQGAGRGGNRVFQASLKFEF